MRWVLFSVGSLMNFQMNQIPKSLVLVAAVVAIFLTGCSTTEEGSSKQVSIFNGMAVEDLIAEIGEPTSVKPTDPVSEDSEIWLYVKKYSHMEYKVTGVKETPYFDPITGESRPIIDPIYESESTRFIKITQFLVLDGKVAGWKIHRTSDRDYN